LNGDAGRDEVAGDDDDDDSVVAIEKPAGGA
jgi:hypothetical protein